MKNNQSKYNTTYEQKNVKSIKHFQGKNIF